MCTRPMRSRTPRPAACRRMSGRRCRALGFAARTTSGKSWALFCLNMASSPNSRRCAAAGRAAAPVVDRQPLADECGANDVRRRLGLPAAAQRVRQRGRRGWQGHAGLLPRLPPAVGLTQVVCPLKPIRRWDERGLMKKVRLTVGVVPMGWLSA
eukprot:16429721-Heterocapsa_arctica.AAC.1